MIKTNSMEGFEKDGEKNLDDYLGAVSSLLDLANAEINNLKPSEWVEQNRMLTSDMSSVEGPFLYERTPYTREIIDCMSHDHPARTIVVKKAAQIGFTDGVILNAIAWIIRNNPGNIMYLIGHSDLLSAAAKDLDNVIDSTQIRHLIQSSAKRARNVKSGDTDEMKEFSGGFLKLGPTNHKSLRQLSIQFMIVDDYDEMISSSVKSGDTRSLIQQRTAAFAKKKKELIASTPLLKGSSNIEDEYLRGDQRKFHIPCQCCGEKIVLEWSIESEVDPQKKVGITWELDGKDKLIPESVGYTCQKCDGFFDDSNKMAWLQEAEFIPTAIPEEPGIYSFHISALSAPIFMYTWLDYVYQYLRANPPGGQVDVEKMKTFTNLVLGEPFEVKNQTVSAQFLQNNIRPYEIGTVPEKLSIQDGNGKIIMITCGVDLNGREDDARIDYEVIAYSAGGQSYSITHGSIGTFIPRDKNREKRRHTMLSYNHNVPNSAWTHLALLLNHEFINDNNGNKMKIFKMAIDTGYMTKPAYKFIDSYSNVIGVKGDDDAKAISEIDDIKSFRYAKERAKLVIVRTNFTKDVLATQMGLVWKKDISTAQEYGFMNFPTPSEGLYLPQNYFNHFESEEKQIDSKGKYRWMKKQGKENHLFDCRLYGDLAKDIFLEQFFSKYKIKNATWSDYSKLMKGFD